MGLWMAAVLSLYGPGIPPEQLNVAPAAEMSPITGRSWRRLPHRQTMTWWTGTLRWCDDPDCPKCAEHVYGVVGGWKK